MDVIEQLEHLIRIDRDAVRAYSQAIENVQDGRTRRILRAFRGDHERHIEDLSAALSALGGKPPANAHFSGFALAGFTGIAAGMGVSAALMAMQSNEVVTNQAYELARNSDTPWPESLRDLLARNHADERHHLDTIRRALAQSSPVGAAMSGSATAQGLGASMWMNVIRTNPLATAMAATGAAFLLRDYLLGRRGGKHRQTAR